jgi:hypothetical protein
MELSDYNDASDLLAACHENGIGDGAVESLTEAKIV